MILDKNEISFYDDEKLNDETDMNTVYRNKFKVDHLILF